MPYPSSALYPSLSLYPGADGVQAIALGVGAAGALVDVTARVNGPEGVTYSYGRQSEFRDPSPGRFTFVLDNYDGRFTPGNPASTDPTPLTEGTAACWQLGSRLVQGYVESIGFATSEEQWGRVTITVGDVFYMANRMILGDLAATIGSTQAWLYWPLTDPATSGQAAEKSGNNGPALQPDPVSAPLTTFGVAPTAPTADTQATFTNTAAQVQYWETAAAFPTINYPAGTYGAWGFWVTPQTGNFWAELDVYLANGNQINLYALNQGSGVRVNFVTTGGSVTTQQSWTSGPHYVAGTITYSGTTFTLTLYVDGVSVGSTTYTATGVTNSGMQPTNLRIAIGDGITAGSVSLAHISHAPAFRNEAAAGITTTATRAAALLSCVPQAVIGSLDSNLSSAPLDQTSATGGTVWAMLLDLLRGEQGHLYTSTTGSLLNPTTVVNMRARTRPPSVTLTLDAAADVEGVPQFERDVTNLYATVTASGPNRSATVTDAAAVARVGVAGTSDTVAFRNTGDLLAYAQDRMQRGENIALKMSKVQVDTTTSSVTLAQLLALTPGDRVQVTRLPTAALGFTTWDGWFIGADELHTFETDTFTLYLAPVLPRTAVFDTDLFSAGTDLSLTSSITSSATSMTVTTANPLTFLETVQVPYTLQVDAEQVTVTACTALSAGTQTATITRGANGTTAAAHATGALVDVAQPGIYAF